MADAVKIQDVYDSSTCIYNGKLIEITRIDAFRRSCTELDDALAQQLMEWTPNSIKQYWLQASNNDCTGFVRFFGVDAEPDKATLWQPSRSVNQARMCLDYIANCHESRNDSGRPRMWIGFQITPFHIFFFPHDRSRTLFCCTYAIDGSDLDKRFAMGVLVSHSIMYNEIVRTQNKRAEKRKEKQQKKRQKTLEEDVQEEEEDDDDDDEVPLCPAEVVPEHYLEQPRHEVVGRMDTRIDENNRRKRCAINNFYKGLDFINKLN